MCRSTTDPSTRAHLVEQGNCIGSVNVNEANMRGEKSLGLLRGVVPLPAVDSMALGFDVRALTVISSLRLLPLKSKYVSDVEML